MAQTVVNPHEELIRRCKAGDAQAQYALYQRYSKAMFNTALRIVNHVAEAEDVLQEAFLTAFTRLDSYNGTATFGAWLKRIVVNKSIDLVKARKADIVSLEEASLNGKPQEEDDQMESDYSVEDIMAAMNTLPEGYRIVFSLYLLEGYDHQEIAEILGISVSGSKSQLNRAKNKMKEILTSRSYV
jgi:RNA polymerase sigma-70 factor (ECF subfamily)